MKPKVIHITGGSQHHLCGDVLESSWGEKYLDDSFAKTLPVCEDCLESYELNYGLDAKNRLMGFWETGIQIIESPLEMIEVEVNLTQTKRELKTLREYLVEGTE